MPNKLQSTEKRKWVHELLNAVRGDLPGSWTLRGSNAANLTLIREPIGWSIAWIGCDPSRTGKVYPICGVQPIAEFFASGLTAKYSMRLDEAEIGQRLLDLKGDDALSLLREFVTGPGLAEVATWTDENLARAAEASYAEPPGRRYHEWFGVAGWRAITGSGDPVRPAEEAIAHLESLSAFNPDRIDFYLGLIAAWESGAVEAARGYLIDQRDQALATLRLDRVIAP